MNLLYQKKEELLAHLELLRQKMLEYQKKLAIEYDIDVKFKLEKSIEISGKKREELNRQLAEIEQQINLEQEDTEIVNSDNEQTGFEIIGLDLGHGETAIAYTTSYSSSDPQAVDLLNNKNSILTAIALDSERGILIGDDAYCYHKAECLKIRSWVRAIALCHRKLS